MIDGVSVIVCCYNSESRLPKTIEHLAKQITNGISYEVIIVDNNCTDNTVTVAQEEWNKYVTNASFKIVEEKTPGLSSARHKGVAVASYEYVVFCDDDNWLAEDYCEIVFEMLSKNNHIGAIGGQSTATTDCLTGLPDWFEQAKSAYAVGKQAISTSDVSDRMYLWGSGLGFKKTLYNKAYATLPSLLSDRNGKELSSGGDSECCIRFLLLGYQLYYDERLKFVHFIPNEKLSKLYYNHLEQSFEKAHAVLSYYRLKYSLNKISSLNKAFCIIKSFYNIFLSNFVFSKKKHLQYNKLILLFLVDINLSSIPKEAKLVQDKF